MQQTIIKKKQMQIRINEERLRISKQVSTMGGLQKALKL